MKTIAIIHYHHCWWKLLPLSITTIVDENYYHYPSPPLLMKTIAIIHYHHCWWKLLPLSITNIADENYCHYPLPTLLMKTIAIIHYHHCWWKLLPLSITNIADENYCHYPLPTLLMKTIAIIHYHHCWWNWYHYKMQFQRTRLMDKFHLEHSRAYWHWVFTEMWCLANDLHVAKKLIFLSVFVKLQFPSATFGDPRGCPESCPWDEGCTISITNLRDRTNSTILPSISPPSACH